MFGRVMHLCPAEISARVGLCVAGVLPSGSHLQQTAVQPRASRTAEATAVRREGIGVMVMGVMVMTMVMTMVMMVAMIRNRGDDDAESGCGAHADESSV